MIIRQFNIANYENGSHIWAIQLVGHRATIKISIDKENIAKNINKSQKRKFDYRTTQNSFSRQKYLIQPEYEGILSTRQSDKR